MSFADISIVALLAALIAASTPILLAAIGELVVERAGVLNLGVEGMMIIGAVTGFLAAVETSNPYAGFAFAAVCGAALSLLFALLTQVFMTNQVASGLALTLFGLGVSARLGDGYQGVRPPQISSLNIPVLSDIPVIGPLLFSHDAIVYLSVALVIAVAWFLRSTRAGMVLRAVGENHDAAHALGFKVIRIRVAAILFGGACAGLGGAYISLVRVPQWADGMTAGAGWIALAIVVFASWRPGRVLLGAYLFGGVTVLQLNLQAAGSNFPVAYLSMAPYLATILVLVAMSLSKSRKGMSAPASLGQAFHASR